MSISVIIPVFNDVKYVKDAIKSVLAQKEVSEIIIVEDGSTDGSKEVCLQFEKKYDRVKVYNHESLSNRGAAASRNLGLSKSTCEIIAFLDADDLYVQKRFDKSYQFLIDNPEVDMVYEPTLMHSTITDVIDSNIFFVERHKHFSKFECYFTSNKGWIHLNAITIRRTAFEKIGYFDNNLLRLQDTDLILRAFQKLNCHEINSDTHVAIHRIHDQVGSNFPENIRKYRIIFYQKWYKIIMIEKHHPAFVRHFLNRMLFYSLDSIYYDKNQTRRKLKKLFYFSKMIIHDFRIVFKIL